MPDMFTGEAFTLEVAFRNEAWRPVHLKGVDRSVYIYIRVGYGGQDGEWIPFGDPLPLVPQEHPLYGAHVHDVYHFALADAARWSPVVRDGVFRPAGAWEGPDIGMLMEEAVVFDHMTPKGVHSLEWCLAMGQRGGLDCDYSMLSNALKLGRHEHRRAMRDFERHGESVHLFEIKMLAPAFWYGGKHALQGVHPDNPPDL